MKRVMVRYKVKSDRAAENQQLVEAVFAELAQSQPAGLRYVTFKHDDGLSFMHLASVETADGSNPLFSVAAFKTFSAQVKDRCEEPPVSVELHEVGSYRVFS